MNQLIQNYLSAEEIDRLQQAYFFARDAHKGQTRLSGEAYITHPVAVACILAEMKLDHETLTAALLHDVIEDTSINYCKIEQLFGKNIAGLVEGVSKLDKLKFRSKKEAQIENFRKMMMAIIKDIRVLLIKFADRTHNMRTIESLHIEKRRRIARETLEIYIPLAHHLGMYHVKTELGELGFKALYPNRYRVIKKGVKISYGKRKEIAQKIISEIENQLQKAGIPCRISNHEKYSYSIYCKMLLKEKRFHSIVNIYVFRVIVRDSDACYRVLGQIHSLYRPKPGCVKDYIAIPRANGYQSLHTSIIGPYGIPLEVQIRTEDMDRIAEMGVAAHLTRKGLGEIKTIIQVQVQHWMQNLLELRHSTSKSFKFIEDIKSDFLSREIHIFTPRRKIIELPVCSSSVDFTYSVHTNILDTPA